MDFGEHVPANEIKIWFIILMAVNLQTSFLTPPFGFALFYTQGHRTKRNQIQSIYKGLFPLCFSRLSGWS